MDGLKLLKEIKLGKITQKDTIIMNYRPSGKKTILKIQNKNLQWQPGEFEIRMLIDDNYNFEIYKEKPEKKPTTLTYTKYNLGKVKVCEGLTTEKLKELGFTNYNPKKWYFCRTISQNEKAKQFHETFNVHISDDLLNIEIDILDEAFLQPAYPYFHYYLEELPFEKCSPYIQEGIKKCDEYIKHLVDNGVFYFTE